MPPPAAELKPPTTRNCSRRAGHRLAELLADHLYAVQSAAGDVLPWRPPDENVQLAADLLRQAAGSDDGRQALLDQFSTLVQTMLAHGHNLHHPRYIGHQVAASLPLAGLMDAVGSVTNQAMAIYDMGPWATAAEWAMIAELGQRIGWQPGTFAGLATHGGSLANLTALLTARNVTLGDCWSSGCVVRPSRLTRWRRPHHGPSWSPMPTPTIPSPVQRASSGWAHGKWFASALTGGGGMDPQKLDSTLADLPSRPADRGRQRLRTARRRSGPSIHWTT